MPSFVSEDEQVFSCSTVDPSKYMVFISTETRVLVLPARRNTSLIVTGLGHFKDKEHSVVADVQLIYDEVIGSLSNNAVSENPVLPVVGVTSVLETYWAMSVNVRALASHVMVMR